MTVEIVKGDAQKVIITLVDDDGIALPGGIADASAVTMSLIRVDHSEAVAGPVVCTNTGDSDFANCVVAGLFSALLTAAMDASQVAVEVQVVGGANAGTYFDMIAIPVVNGCNP